MLPAGYRSVASGGNIYDRHLVAGLPERGWQACPHETDPATVADAMPAPLAPGSLVLLDSLVGSWAAPQLLAGDLDVVPLVHMLFGTPGEHELLAGAAVVITTSEWTRQALIREHGLDPRRIHPATPGVDVAPRSPGTESGGELLCVAALVPGKGHDVLLAALARLTDLDWRCRLVGSLDHDPAHVDVLRKQAADAGIAERVRMLGVADQAALAAAYAHADLLVLPSRAETYAMVVTEALARGLPVVASAVGGVPEAVGEVAATSVQTRPGMLVRPDDAEALARALRRWLEDEPLRRWLRRAAAARIPSLSRWPQTVARVSHALEAAR